MGIGVARRRAGRKAVDQIQQTARQAARTAKDFERADAIRDELASMGYEIRDSAEGPRLVPKS